MDRLWCTIATEGWDDTKLRAERFQRIGSSNVPALAGMRAAVELANQIGMDRIEKRHRTMADYILSEMIKRGAQSWTSPDPALRCGIATITVAPVKMPDLEKALWKERRFAYAEQRRTRFACRHPTICFEETWTTSSQPSTSTGKHERAGFG